jgi:hypothetical protein
MIDWFHTLPNAVIGLLIGLTAIIGCIVAPVYIRRRLKWEVSGDVAKGAEEAFKITASMTMALLAFSLVQVQSLHRSVEDLAARESTIILKVSRALGAFDDPAGIALRGQVQAYARSVVTDEWPLLARGERSEKTTSLLAGVVKGAGQLQPATPAQQIALSEVRGGLTQVVDVREARLAATSLSLAPYFWGAIGAVLVILVVIGWFQGPLPKLIVYVGGVTMAISILLTLLIAASGIFAGESRVTPTALEKMIPLLGGPSAE